MMSTLQLPSCSVAKAGRATPVSANNEAANSPAEIKPRMAA
jgi:hypothetical protein